MSDDEKNITIKINAVISAVGLMLGLSADGVFAQQNLIINGSFESGGQAGIQVFPGWDLVGPADNYSDYGLAQSSVYPEVAEQGRFYAYFHGHPTDGSQDCLGQTVSLTVLLQANASLGTTNWVRLTNAPVTVGSSNRIVMSTPASNLFYRLTLP